MNEQKSNEENSKFLYYDIVEQALQDFWSYAKNNHNLKKLCRVARIISNFFFIKLKSISSKKKKSRESQLALQVMHARISMSDYFFINDTESTMPLKYNVASLIKPKPSMEVSVSSL